MTEELQYSRCVVIDKNGVLVNGIKYLQKNQSILIILEESTDTIIMTTTQKLTL